MVQPASPTSNVLHIPSLRRSTGLARFIKPVVHCVLLFSLVLLTLYFFTHPQYINLSYLPWCLVFDLVALTGFVAAVGVFLRYSSPHRTSRLYSPIGYALPHVVSLPPTTSSSASSPPVPHLRLAPPILIPVNVLADHTPLLTTTVPVSLNSPDQISVHTSQYNTFETEVSPCCVCLELLTAKSSVVALQCSHRFHECCILDWLQRKRHCPICRSGT